MSPLAEGVREATVLSWTSGYKQQRYVRHAASGDRTLCGIQLGDRRIPDLPGFTATDAIACGRAACRRGGVQ
jgi:hypothetical protein